MLYLYQSNRLEDLAALFTRVHRLQPPANPLAAEEIVVQSQGMRRYLNTYLARETGVAANLRFSLPAGLAWQLMRTLIPGVPALSPFSPEVMRWRLLGLFQSPQFETAPEYRAARSALQSYLGSGGSAAYQLAGQLADIFDQYLVYRPQWIDAWQQGKTAGLGGDETWQAELWRYLDGGGTQTPHRVALWRQLLNALDQTKLPERYFVFGTATMAPMYLQLLQALAQHCDVHVFALNPSSGYWGDVLEPAQLLRSGDTDPGRTGHPLLASLGKQGRDFFDALAETPKHEISVFDDETLQKAPTLLHRIQHDIQTLTMPSESPHGSAAGLLHDGSVQIVSAHSPLRELQILKTRLLETLAANPAWQPHDIAVLTPDITPYSPFVEAVFGQAQAGSQALPYSVSDIKISRKEPLFQVLAQTFALLESRFEVNLLLPLLEHDAVRRRFGLNRDDLPLLHDTVAALNVHWGLDKEMRGSRDNLFTWQQGLERIALGWMLPESSHPLWRYVSAWHGNPGHTETLARFCAFVRTLADTARTWRQPATVAGWAERVRALAAALTVSDADSRHARQQLGQSLARWQEEAALAGFESSLPQQTVIRHIGRFLDSESQAGFLSGGITFCSMVPMRSLPFKMICLLGLNDGSFPRNTKAAAFDLIARHPQKGDRARRDDDRYLFLEAIMSAREILYLSYVGRDIRTNQELAPSALINELADTVAAMCGAAELPRDWVKQHPLQPFSRSYFTPGAVSDGLCSTRSDYARALNNPEPPRSAFFSVLPEAAAESAEPPEPVNHHDFIRFWRNPVRSWLHRTLNWREPYADRAWDAAEPFEAQADAVAAEYAAARRQNENFARTEARLQAAGRLPAGELGRLWNEYCRTAAQSLDGGLLSSPKLAPAPYTLALGRQTLEGSLNRLYRHGQIYFPDCPLSSPERIAVLLEHLVFCAVRPSETECFQTHILLPRQTETLHEIPQQTAQNLLEQWLACYRSGQTRPLPFFARTTLAAARAFAESKPGEQRQQAQAAANKAYYGNKKQKGQKDYTEVALVFGGSETPPVETAEFFYLAEHLLAPLCRLTAANGTE